MFQKELMMLDIHNLTVDETDKAGRTSEMKSLHERRKSSS